MEFSEATFLRRINTSLQHPNTSDVIAGERVNMPEGLVNQTLELGGLLDERFQTFNCRPLEKCCGDESLKTSIFANALARFAPFSGIAERGSGGKGMTPEDARLF